MRTLRKAGFLISLLALAGGVATAADHAVDVDPRIGTGGDGHTFPGATVPFGMIQLSPDTAMPELGAKGSLIATVPSLSSRLTSTTRTPDDVFR